MFLGEFVTDSAPASLCLTVGGATMAELRRARDEAASTADLVEVRLDSVKDPDAAGALEGRRGPVLVTCRPEWEGGTFRGSEEERLRLLGRAWTLGAEFVDIEARAEAAPAWLAGTRGERTVLSEHHFDRTPDDLAGRFAAMAASAAAVVKLAVRADRLSDTLPLFSLGARAGTRRFVALAMGLPGLPTRVLATRIGSCWTYAGQSWAPGQVPADRLLGEFRFRKIRATTALYGVVGKPIGHSLSPVMHNAAFDKDGEDAVYLPLEAEDASDFLAFAEALGVKGTSVTAPFKLALAPFAALDEAAARVGALNTLRLDGDGWKATNTDVAGFLAPLESRLELRGVRASVLGTGGAARAVVLALGARGATVTVHGRDAARAASVASLATGKVGPWPPAPGTWDLLVNATPVGTAPHVDDTPLPHGPFDGRLVYDLVYNPPRTRLLEDASARGCETLGGLEMLIAQAQAQREFWTGRRPDAGVMRDAALGRLEAAAVPPATRSAPA